MYFLLLPIHSIVRWLVLGTLLYSIYRSYRGWRRRLPFTEADNRLRHWTATTAHVQLIVGVTLYFISPLPSWFWSHYQEGVRVRGIRFFAMEHSLMMLVAIVLITIGSALAKRKASDIQKFRTIAIWYTVALVLILINIPWPFSPMAGRPWIRGF